MKHKVIELVLSKKFRRRDENIIKYLYKSLSQSTSQQHLMKNLYQNSSINKYNSNFNFRSHISILNFWFITSTAGAISPHLISSENSKFSLNLAPFGLNRYWVNFSWKESLDIGKVERLSFNGKKFVSTYSSKPGYHELTSTMMSFFSSSLSTKSLILSKFLFQVQVLNYKTGESITSWNFVLLCLLRSCSSIFEH